MNENYIINQLEYNSNVFRTLLSNIDKEHYMWKQNKDKWCLLEIVCHLYDEEREDFRARVKYVLELPDYPPKPISSDIWVLERKYIEQDYYEMLSKFLAERKDSIKWLKNLDNPKWENVYKHPRLGDVSAKMFFVNWLAHDYLHIRQIIKLKFDYLANKTGENLIYAGGW